MVVCGGGAGGGGWWWAVVRGGMVQAGSAPMATVVGACFVFVPAFGGWSRQIPPVYFGQVGPGTQSLILGTVAVGFARTGGGHNHRQAAAVASAES